jgi:hypothetical protein
LILHSGYDIIIILAAVVKLADTRDLKSLGSDTVPVRVRSAAPAKIPMNAEKMAFIGILLYQEIR